MSDDEQPEDGRSSATEVALDIAGELIDAGIPVFAAPPCPAGPHAAVPAGTQGVCSRPGHSGGQVEYDLPAKWQLTVPSRVWLERWQPGWALAAVGGHVADFLDEDPRSGGDASVGELAHAGHWPTVFGEAATPSGGRHYLISPLGERKVVGLLPGLDYQGGAPDGRGRGFVWIAPTVKRSKVDGVTRAYEWTTPPDLEWLADYQGLTPGSGHSDASIEGVRSRIMAAKARRAADLGTPGDGAAGGQGGEARRFTETQARQFCDITLKRLQSAQIGEIEEAANAAACTLSRFVPQFWSEEQAYDVLFAALGETAYDPEHPASTWEADKFHAVIAGERGRAPSDWHAVRVPETMDEAVAATPPQGDEVSALLAEMLPPSVLAGRTPPRYMIKGMLTYDSECWMIGGPGSKKSFVVLDMAAHVALGRPWQGLRVNRGVCLLIVGEGAGSIGKRITAWQKKYGPMPDDAIRILPRPVQAARAEDWAVLVRAVERVRAVTDPALGMFIAVDTQARSTIGLDENKAEEMGVYVEALAALRKVSGACVLSVHHTTKAGTSTRGSGAQDGAQYSRLLMKSEKGSLVSSLISDKQKDLEEAEPLELRFAKVDVGQDEDGEPLDSLVLLPRDEWGSALFDGRSADAAAAERDADAVRVLDEPAAWTRRFFEHNKQELARRILQALAELGGEHGRTEASLRKSVIETWYPKGEGRGKGRLQVDTTESGWGRAWRQCRELMTDGAEPEPVVAALPGPRFTINPIVRVTDE